MGIVYGVRLSEERRKRIQVNLVLANVEHSVPQGTHGADRMEGAGGMSMGRGEK